MLSEVHINMPNRHSTLTSLFVDIADSIRSKTGDSAKIKADDFDTAIEAIQTGGGGETVELSVTQNGTYVPDEGTTYSKVSVNVPQTVASGTVKALLDATKSCYYLFSSYRGTSVDGLISYADTSNVTSMSYMFHGCENLTTIPQLDTSNVLSMNDMFDGCNKLASIPQLDTSKVTNMSSMFAFCRNLTTIPLLDTSKVTNFGSWLYSCESLTSIPQLNTSSATNMNSMFQGNKKLTTIPQLDTSKVTNMYYTFQLCTSLTTIPALDVSKVTNTYYMFGGCSSLKSILMYGMKVSFDIHASTKFEESDLVTILNNLATVTSTQTLTMGATNLAKLTDEEKAIATNKGWTLA